MSTAWETTIDDVQLVADVHGLNFSEDQIEEIHSNLDHGSIERGVLFYTDMDDQTDSMLCDIEDHLISTGILSKNAEKQFKGPFVTPSSPKN